MNIQVPGNYKYALNPLYADTDQTAFDRDYMAEHYENPNFYHEI